MPVALTVRPRATAEAVPTHDTLKSPTFGCARHINQLSGTKQISPNHVTDVVLVDTIGSEFAQIPQQTPRTREVPPFWLGEALGGYLAVTELDCLVAIPLTRAYLRHDAWTNFEHRDGDDLA